MNILEFANPAAWWWALLALPIIGLYILKVRLRRVPATTLLFWNQLYDEKKPRSWWQHLRHWLSLLLQLAFLLLLVSALVDVLPLELDAEETITRILNHTSAAGGRMQATLDVEDALSVDNRAVAILPTRDPIPVRLATDGNLFASNVLRSIPLVDLSVIPAVDTSTSNDASNVTARRKNVTATPIQVFDRSVPEKLPPGRVFVSDPQNDCDLWTLGDSIGQPLVAAVDTDSPLTQHVRLDNVLFTGAKQIEFKGPAEALIRDPYDAPLLARLRRPGGDVIVLTCNLSEGDLPLRIAFPVLMKNAIEWFAGDSGELQAAAAAGELVRLNAETLTPVTQTGGSDSQPLTSATDRDRPESVTADEQATVENPTAAQEGDLERRRAAGSEPVILTSAQPASASNRLELVDPTGKASPVAISNGRIVLGPLLHTGVWKLRAVRETRTGTGTGTGPDAQSIEELNPSSTDTDRDTAAGADATSDENSGAETRREREDSEDSETVGANGEDAEDGAIRLLACNLVSTEESDLRPKVELPRAARLGMTLLGGRSIWFYLTLLAATLIATEWWLYQRRIIG